MYVCFAPSLVTTYLGYMQVLGTYQVYNAYTEPHSQKEPCAEGGGPPSNAGPHPGAGEGPHPAAKASTDLGTREANVALDAEPSGADMKEGEGEPCEQQTTELPVELLYEHGRTTKPSVANTETQCATPPPLLEHTITTLRDVLGTVGQDVKLSHQLAKLSESTISATAKENLLLSLRCVQGTF